jgi:hypothetical protein
MKNSRSVYAELMVCLRKTYEAFTSGKDIKSEQYKETFASVFYVSNVSLDLTLKQLFHTGH